MATTHLQRHAWAQRGPAGPGVPGGQQSKTPSVPLLGALLPHPCLSTPGPSALGNPRGCRPSLTNLSPLRISQPLYRSHMGENWEAEESCSWSPWRQAGAEDVTTERQGVDSFPPAAGLRQHRFLRRCSELPAASLRAKLRGKPCTSLRADLGRAPVSLACRPSHSILKARSLPRTLDFQVSPDEPCWQARPSAA